MSEPAPIEPGMPDPVQRIIRSKAGGCAPQRHGPSAVRRRHLAPGVFVSRFTPPRGPEELYLLIEPDAVGRFGDQLEQVTRRYEACLARLGLASSTAVFRRFFLSDAANQLEALMASRIAGQGPGADAVAVSCIEQPVLPHRKVALQAYHLSDVAAQDKMRVALPGAGRHAHALVLRRRDHTLLYGAQFTAGGEGRCCCDQTRGIFLQVDRFLELHGATLADHVVRTWLFVDGIDRNYMDVVSARREVFRQHGLTAASHYIVSTGIQGRGPRSEDTLVMDLLAVAGLQPGQQSYIDDLDHLNRTSDYGVTFERAARLDFGDRSHFLVAGTASIDREGAIVHPGDLPGQIERTLENIAALLDAGGASFDDLTVMTVYLRDPADAQVAALMLEKLAPGLPWTMVQAPVCRPGWLVEIEAMAAVAHDEPRWPPY